MVEPWHAAIFIPYIIRSYARMASCFVWQDFAGKIVICKGQGTGRVGLVKETRMTEHG